MKRNAVEEGVTCAVGTATGRLHGGSSWFSSVHSCLLPFKILVVVYLTTLSGAQTIYSVEWEDDEWRMNWKGCERKRSWSNLRYFPGIFVEGPRKATQNLSQDSRSLGIDLNPGPPEYEAARPLNRPLFSSKLIGYHMAVHKHPQLS
jgi:hypothetical protein